VPLLAALFILGPERLPGAAAAVAKALRQVQQYATSARAQLKDELGPEFDDLRKPLAGLHKRRGMTATSLITKHLFDGDANAFPIPIPAPAPVSGAPVSMAKGAKFDPVSPQPPLALVLGGAGPRSTLQAACDAVGVNRRTGRRWRQGTGGRIPRKRPEHSGRYRGLEERLRIADLRLAGVGVRAIGIQLGRSPSAISRELTRNGPQRGVSGRVPSRCAFPWRAEMQVCHETIYLALFVQGRGHLRADLHQHLRTGRAVRRPRRSTVKRTTKIPDMVRQGGVRVS